MGVQVLVLGFVCQCSSFEGVGRGGDFHTWAAAKGEDGEQTLVEVQHGLLAVEANSLAALLSKGTTCLPAKTTKVAAVSTSLEVSELLVDVKSRLPHVEAGTCTAKPGRLVLWEEDVGGLGPQRGQQLLGKQIVQVKFRLVNLGR